MASEGRVEFWKLFRKAESAKEMLIPTGTVLEGKECALLLDSNGDKWPVLITKRNTDYFLSKGWKEFCLANSIKDEFAIRFTYVGKATFNVMIFKPNDHLETERNSEKRGRGQPHEVTPREQRVADAFGSNNPYIIRTLIWHDGKFPVLCIPNKFLTMHHLTLTDKQKIVFRNHEGSPWKITVNQSKSNFFIGEGFPRFLKDNRVKHGIILVCEVLDDTAMEFRVHFYR